MLCPRLDLGGPLRQRDTLADDGSQPRAHSHLQVGVDFGDEGRGHRVLHNDELGDGLFGGQIRLRSQLGLVRV